jgi:hypothetical protein
MVTPYTVAPFAQPKAVTAAQAAPIVAPQVETYGAITRDMDKPLRIEDLPIEPVSLPAEEPVAAIRPAVKPAFMPQPQQAPEPEPAREVAAMQRLRAEPAIRSPKESEQIYRSNDDRTAGNIPYTKRSFMQAVREDIMSEMKPGPRRATQPVPAAYEPAAGAMPLPSRKPSSTPLRQQNRASGVFSQNLEDVYGGKAPSNMMDSMNGYGYVLD